MRGWRFPPGASTFPRGCNGSFARQIGSDSWENRPIPAPLDKQIVFVTGKGGVGKTTVSLALGLAAAASGKRTIICEVASQEHAAEVFGVGKIGFTERHLAKNLFAISIDPDDAIREYLEVQLPVKAMGDLLYRSKIFTYLAAATPGLREMVTIGKIWELALNSRKTSGAEPYDLVIVDAPATGHGIGMIESPGNFREMARVGPMARQAGLIEKTITNPEKTGVVLVAIPEEMPVNETASLERQLTDRAGVGTDLIVLNSLFPDRFSTDEAETIERAVRETPQALRGPLVAALDARSRAASGREQLERLKASTEAPVETLPFLFEPQLGREQLETLAEILS